jgi:hypothetical protein
MILLTLGLVSAADAPLAPRPVTLPKAAVSLQTALDDLRAQSGNAVGDLRAVKTNPSLHLRRTKGSFWPLLDEIGRSSGIGFSAYAAEGVALVDAPYRAVPTSYSGLFRLALKRIAASLDFEIKTHLLHVTLDVTWEPRFQPFYLEARNLSATYPGRTVEIKEQGQLAVAGRGATELELRLPAPERGAARISVLEGTLAVIGPTRMLEFRFDKLAPLAAKDEPRQQTQDGVTVRLTRLVAGQGHWSVDVLIENPPGAPVFESFQSWLDNNKIALVREERGKTITWTPEPSEEQQLGQLTARRAQIRYHFPLEAGKKRGQLGDWTLTYRTPGRIVQVEVPFQFKDVPLP